jgi:hypothetical protein
MRVAWVTCPCRVVHTELGFWVVSWGLTAIGCCRLESLGWSSSCPALTASFAALAVGVSLDG